MEQVAEQLHAWHDFFVTLATASVTLIGAMFVVLSIGSAKLTPERLPQIRAFFTATVVHLASVLLGGLLTMVPSLERTSFAALLAVGGLVVLGFSFYVVPVIWRHGTDVVLEDWFWYAGSPILAYLAVLASAAGIALGWHRAFELFAASLVLLLITGIRNAWDLIIYLVTRPRLDQ
jgi:hypothetical protein